MRHFPLSKDWTSGYSLVAEVDLLIHDAQYSAIEYPNHVGWGHSSLPQALKYAELAGVKILVPFHHDPSHNDGVLDQMFAEAAGLAGSSVQLRPGTEGNTFEF